MHLATIDWIIIVGFLVGIITISISYTGKAGKNLANYFLGGRNLPWYIAGVSIVATTFAADTPLWVAEKVAQYGVSGNWLWWNMVIGGMLTTFFFAKLWRRAGVLTELEFLELRYSGQPAAFLRGFKSVYLGVFLNAIIIGWVNAAMIKIMEGFFGFTYNEALMLVLGMMVLVSIYSSLSGLLGVAITDVIQFTIAMVGCVILAIVVLNTEKVGGISGLKVQLPEWRFDFFPSLGGSNAVGTFSLSIGAFLSYGLIQWWASWYPGAEPGGGGYAAQRMMSAKNEKHAVYSSLFFNVAHYCLRPWPWIIVGLCALVLYDLPVEESSKGFVYAMRDYLPAGLKGLLLVAFIAAYMSTISTQLNWGSSFLTSDLYKRFFRPESSFENEEKANKDYVQKARLFTIVIMVVGAIVTTQIGMIDEAAQFLIACGAGLGMVLILRWYWWRINAWSEIVATAAPLFALSFCKWVLEPQLGDSFIENNGSFYVTVGFTTIAWLVATFVTPPTDQKVLTNFYKRVTPGGAWGKIRKLAGVTVSTNNLPVLFISWLSSVVFVYSVLFLIGKVIFAEWQEAGIWLAVGAVSLTILMLSMRREERQS